MDNTIDTLGDLSAQKGFKLVHLNIRSLFKKLDQLKILLDSSKIDVVTLSETWLNTSIFSTSINLEGYGLYRQDRSSGNSKKGRGGGLLTYIRKDHSANSEVMPDLNRSNMDIEAQWTLIHRDHCKDMIICNIYRPPRGNIQKAISYLDECFKQVRADRVEIFVLGDLNINYKNKVSGDFKKLKFFMQTNGLSQLITNTTRNNDKTKSLIDLVLTNSKHVSAAGTLNHFVSDHQPIYVIKKKKRDVRAREEFIGRSYRNYNSQAFKGMLKDHNWNEFYKLTDPSDAWDYILNQVTPILDMVCPLKSFKIQNYRPEWMTNELIEQIKDRDYFYQIAKSTGNLDSWNIAKHLRNTTNANIRQAKREFVLSELDNCGADGKKFWHSIKSVIPSNKGSAKRDILLKNEGVKLEKNSVAHFINDYFINIGKTTYNLDLSGNPAETLPTETDSDVGWVPDEFGVHEVLRIVKDINTSKSSGLQHISSYIVKEVFTALIDQVIFMFNLSLRTSIFPEAWKNALVIPLPKSGDLTQVANYRPISLLPLPGKILEKLIHKQFTDFIEDNSLLTNFQHGFRKQHSTIHSVTQLTNFVNEKMDRGLPTLAAFVDFRKAFDCVQHGVLLSKLSRLGIGRGMLDWFGSYLSMRKQRVLANSTLSSFQTITQGVPQGSVLGPIFYILYANDIIGTLKNCKVALYADDTVLYTANNDFANSISKVRQDMLALSHWCNCNGINMNINKTKLMVFGAAKKLKKLPAVNISVDGIPLQTVTTYKYLGVTLDSQLNYGRHVSNVLSNASLRLRQLRRMRSFLTTKAATMVYKNMILPIVEYGDVLMFAASAENRRKLQILQNKGLRCALNTDRFTHVTDLHAEVDLLKLKFRREQHLLSLMYDQAQKGHLLSTRKKNCIVTRSHKKKLFKTKRPRTEKFKKSVAYTGPKMWNDLPAEFHQTETKEEFKRLVYARTVTKALNVANAELANYEL